MTDQPNVELEETRLANGMIMWAPKNIKEPRELTPAEKINLDKKDKILAAKAESRQETCWECAKRQATVWVHEVGFDFKGDKADPLKHVTVSSADYNGPVPGFCTFCLGVGPSHLAEVVYHSRPEVHWGVRPTRWFVAFTDGTKQGDAIVTLNPTQYETKITEEHIGTT